MIFNLWLLDIQVARLLQWRPVRLDMWLSIPSQNDLQVVQLGYIVQQLSSIIPFAQIKLAILVDNDLDIDVELAINLLRHS